MVSGTDNSTKFDTTHIPNASAHKTSTKNSHSSVKEYVDKQDTYYIWTWFV